MKIYILHKSCDIVLVNLDFPEKAWNGASQQRWTLNALNLPRWNSVDKTFDDQQAIAKKAENRPSSVRNEVSVGSGPIFGDIQILLVED